MEKNTINRRQFVSRCTTCTAGMTLLPSLGLSAFINPVILPFAEMNKANVKMIFAYPDPKQPNWPNIGYDFKGKINEIKNKLLRNCPEINFDFVSTMNGSKEEANKIINTSTNNDGYVVYLVGCLWGELTEEIAASGKPTVIIDHLYAGSGEFLTSYARVRRQGHKVIAVSSSDFNDVVKAMQNFVCLKKLKQSTILVVGGNADKKIEQIFGVKVLTIDFKELKDHYSKVDTADAKKQAKTWMDMADRIIEPGKDDILRSATMYLAMANLMKEYNARAITINCLGGIYSGQLPTAYPCLGFMELNDTGFVGACEADQRSTLTMLLMTYLTGRPGFISDPVIDTSKNQIIYAHCIAPTKVFGSEGKRNPYHLRSHSEDRKGACNRSLLPLDEMTTTIQFDHNKKKIIFHQGISVENVDDDKACRNKLAVEVKGDIYKLLNEWDQWGWHRVTFYGDLKRQVYDIARLTGFEVLEEA